MDIHFDDSTYTGVLTPNPIWSENGLSKGRMVRIINKNGEGIGCIGIFLSPLTQAVWKSKTGKEVNSLLLHNIILTIIPRIHFSLNFAKVAAIYPHKCLTVYIGDRDTGYVEKENTVYLFNGNTPEEFVHGVIFDGEINDEKIQREILDITYQFWQEKVAIYPTFNAIRECLYINTGTLHRNIDFLIGEKYVRYEDVVTVEKKHIMRLTMSNEGIKYIKNNYSEISNANHTTINIMAKKFAARDINTINSTGDHNQNIINTGDMSLTNYFDELKETIEKDYQDSDKPTVLKETENLKNEAVTTKDKEGILTKLRIFAGKVAKYKPVWTIVVTKIIPLIEKAAPLAKHIKLP